MAIQPGPINFVYTLPASADLSTKQFLFVEVTTGELTVCNAAGDFACGVLQDKPDAAGKPGVKEELLKGYKAGDKSFKVHLDGYDMLDYFKSGGEGDGPRQDGGGRGGRCIRRVGQLRQSGSGGLSI